MQTTLMQGILSRIFKSEFGLEDFFKRVNFLQCDIEAILNSQLLKFSEITRKMNMVVQRQAWQFFLEKTVISYIGCLL